MLQGITKSVRSHSLRPVHQPNALSGKARVEFGTGGPGLHGPQVRLLPTQSPPNVPNSQAERGVSRAQPRATARSLQAPGAHKVGRIVESLTARHIRSSGIA